MTETNYSHKKLHHRCLTGFLNTPLISNLAFYSQRSFAHWTKLSVKLTLPQFYGYTLKGQTTVETKAVFLLPSR